MLRQGSLLAPSLTGTAHIVKTLETCSGLQSSSIRIRIKSIVLDGIRYFDDVFRLLKQASLGQYTFIFLFYFNSRYIVVLRHLMVSAISDTDNFRSKRVEN